MKFSKLFVALWLGLTLVSYAQTITLTTEMPFYPYGVPSEEEQAADPVAKAYAEALQSWLEQNSGVTLEQVDFDIWEPDLVIPAIAGGTVPSFYSANEVGGYIPGPRMGQAASQGLLADVTTAVEKYGLTDQLSDVAKTTWQQFSVDGKTYGLPQAYYAGNGVYYRKDWIKELGLEEPKPGWTWDDFLALAKALTTDEHQGAVVGAYDIVTELTFGDFGWQIPKLGGNWRWTYDYTSKSDKWVGILEKWRTALYEDQSLLYNPDFDDVQTWDAFATGQVAMQISNTGHFTEPPASPTGLAILADEMGKPIDEIFGWVELPRSELDSLSATQPFMALTGVSPDLDEASLDKAVSLVAYMQFGEGYVKQRQAIWETTGDLRAVYDQPIAINGMEQIPGVEGSIDDAWGSTFMNNIREAANNPLGPIITNYLPPEEQGGPGDAALQDAFNVIINTPGDVDIAAELKKAEDISNEQAETFSSSIPEEDFVAGLKKFYADSATFAKENTPQFYEQIWKPWYDTNVAPVIGELE
jgi:ABC-type glycerol-3-phosphate transport system substrate-binding protein